jgi:hypothetical protein
MNSDSNHEIATLQRQVFFMLLALIIVSGTLTAYIFWQAWIFRKDVNGFRPQAERVIELYNQKQALMVNFEKELIAYGQTHPDFRPVLIKNGIIPNTPAPATPAAAPAPQK